MSHGPHRERAAVRGALAGVNPPSMSPLSDATRASYGEASAEMRSGEGVKSMERHKEETHVGGRWSGAPPNGTKP